MGEEYSCGVGEVIFGGGFRRPLWRRSIAKNSWGEIPATLLSAIDPQNDPLINPNYPRYAPWNRTSVGLVNKPTINQLMDAYGGGAWDEEKCEFWLPLESGHSDGGDNGSRKTALKTDFPFWLTVCYPSGSIPRLQQDGGLPAGCTPQDNSFLLDDGKESTGVYADGRPRASHSYGKHVIVPGLGPVMALHAGSFTAPPSPSAMRYAIHLDEASKEWIQHPTSTHANLNNANSSYACFDTKRGVVYLQVDGTATLLRLDLSTWTYTDAAAAILSSQYTSCIYIPDYDIVFQACAYYANKFCIKDPANGQAYLPPVIGGTPAIAGETGQCWVPGIGMVFVVGKALYSLAPTGNPRTDAWQWSLFKDVDNSIPTDTSSAGPWKKIDYSKTLGGIFRFTNASNKPSFFATE